MLGKPKFTCLSGSEQLVNDLLNSIEVPELPTTSVLTYDRAAVRGQTVYAESNTRVKKRNSFTVQFCVADGVKYGLVETFVSDCTNHMARIRLLRVQPAEPPNVNMCTDLLFEEFSTYRETSEILFVFVVK